MIRLVNFLQRKFPEIFSEGEYETLLKEVEEEKQELSNLTTERDLLMLPETVGHLITSHITMSKMNSTFYAEHPEFRDKKDIVASVIEMVEGQNPFEDYESLLKRSVPKIRERINTMKNLDMSNVNPNPDRNFGNLEIGEADGLNPHGDL